MRKRLLSYDARAIIIADEGREMDIERALRRMHVHNPIPSRFGGWAPGVMSKNITTDHIIEDPFFKQSHRSFFVQLVDCCSYALLKREVPPTPIIEKYGINGMFDELLAPICFQGACNYDPLGIVRK